MGLLDELLKAQKPKRNLMGTQMVKGPDQPYLRQDYPGLYGALGGLLGTAPDVMEGSVLDPNTAAVRQGAEYGFPVGTALGMLPGVGPGQRGAMAVGRAGERLAERAVPQVMDRGGLLAEMMQGISRGTVSPLDVYHGTPHRFPPTARNPLGEFDASKIGTGEGAQAYGHGIYVAEARPVAEGYRNKLTQSDDFVNGQLLDSTNPLHLLARVLNEESGNVISAKDSLEIFARPGASKSVSESAKQALKLLESGQRPLLQTIKQEGNLYKVDLPDKKIAKMLDWDKPLNQQPEIIKILEKNYRPDYLKMFKDRPGSDFYKAISGNKGMEDLRVLGSSELKNIGIPGVKYLDEGSRQPGVTAMTQAQLDTRINILKKDIDSGLGNQDRMKQILSALQAERASHSNLTRNFVVFPGEEKNLRILERNSQKAPDLLASPIDEEELRRLQSGLLYAP